MTKIKWFDCMLTATTDLFLPVEKQLFLSDFAVTSGLRVLDVGCGNGEYLSRLSRLFPRWSCTGLEMDKGIYEYARKKETPQLTFVHSSYEDYTGKEQYDLVLVRLVAAHLRDQGHFVQWLRERTHRHSTVIILDIEDAEESRWQDNLPLFSSLYRQIRLPLRRSRLLRLRDSLSLEARSRGWDNQELFHYQAAADTADTKHLMYRYMQMVTAYHYGFPLPDQREEELAQWLSNPELSFEVHMFGLLLKIV
ncbi:class I SAM-dependent methyltransferase [Paenibacillus nasutitermitis]|uniref:Methyltransferase domain-containing protein n=1 Tax=Paenibacillus nasutitermitis TaxID=1652958 RepID=A0A916ZG06_9BACL|nr:class I SAM-dependent methyltransferase [Paenibacillus nasutitermitis]GGD94304.1 hypothetical protein GCM10010911_61200 [Paenibacillus nasutitermitis]